MKTLGRLTLASLLLAGTATAQDARLERLKAEAATKVEARAKLVQEIIDMVFSFGELGMQEVETSKYLTGLLEKEGFRIERNVAGIPTAWTATWGSGKPVIALGSDIDGIPQSNQKPGVGYRASFGGSTPVSTASETQVATFHGQCGCENGACTSQEATCAGCARRTSSA